MSAIWPFFDMIYCFYGDNDRVMMENGVILDSAIFTRRQIKLYNNFRALNTYEVISLALTVDQLVGFY